MSRMVSRAKNLMHSFCCALMSISHKYGDIHKKVGSYSEMSRLVRPVPTAHRGKQDRQRHHRRIRLIDSDFVSLPTESVRFLLVYRKPVPFHTSKFMSNPRNGKNWLLTKSAAGGNRTPYGVILGVIIPYLHSCIWSDRGVELMTLHVESRYRPTLSTTGNSGVKNLLHKFGGT